MKTAVTVEANNPQLPPPSDSFPITAPESLLDGLEQSLLTWDAITDTELTDAEELAAQDIEAAIQRSRTITVKRSSVPLLLEVLSQIVMTDVDGVEAKEAATVAMAQMIYETSPSSTQN